MKYLTLLLALIANQSYSQCNKLSTYEDVKYDQFYNWDKVKMTDDDKIILLKHQDTLLSLRCKLRKQNLTRCYEYVIPDEVKQLNYVKSLRIKENNGYYTIPVFKLVLDTFINTSFHNTKEGYQERKQQNIKTINKIKTIKPVAEIPQEFKSYTVNYDVGVKCSKYFEDPYIILKSMDYYDGTINDYIKHNSNLKNEYQLYIDLDKSSRDYFDKHFQFEITLFVDQDAYVTYVAGEFVNSSYLDKDKQQILLRRWSQKLIEDYDFLAATKDSQSVKSYVKVKYSFNIKLINLNESNKTRRKPKKD